MSRGYITADVSVDIDFDEIEPDQSLDLLQYFYEKKKIVAEDVYEIIGYPELHFDVQTLDDKIKMEILHDLFRRLTVSQLQQIQDSL